MHVKRFPFGFSYLMFQDIRFSYCFIISAGFSCIIFVLFGVRASPVWVISMHLPMLCNSLNAKLQGVGGSLVCPFNGGRRISKEVQNYWGPNKFSEVD